MGRIALSLSLALGMITIHTSKEHISRALDFLACLAKGCLELGFVASTKAIQSGMTYIHIVCSTSTQVCPFVIWSVFCKEVFYASVL